MKHLKTTAFLTLAGVAGLACIAEPEKTEKTQPPTPPVYPMPPMTVTPGTTPLPPSTVPTVPENGSSTLVPPVIAPPPANPGQPGVDEWAQSRVRSGSRLKAIYATTPDAKKYFKNEWYDTGMQTRCRFAAAADGQSRCLPLLPLASTQHGLVRYFRDATCGEPLLLKEQACSATYGTKTNPDGFTSIHRLAGSSVVTRAFTVQTDAGGKPRCVAVDVQGPNEFFQLGAEVPAQSFVATASNGAEPVSGRRIWPIVRTTADGMRVRTGWWDSQLSRECTLRRGWDGVTRCMPYLAFAAPLSVYADSGCSQAAAVSRTSPEGTPVRVTDATTCPAREALYRTEVLPFAKTVYRKIGESCTAVEVPAGSKVFVVREPMADTSFVPFNESREGNGRLQQRILTSAEGSVERPSFPLDTGFSDLCGFARGDGGQLFCLPLPAASGTEQDAYADSSCINRVARPAKGLECVQTQHAALVEGAWCAPVVRAKTLAEPNTAAFRRDAAGKCSPMSVPATDYRRIGTDVALGSFVQATDTME